MCVCVSVTIMDFRCSGEDRTEGATDASDGCSWPQTCTSMVPMLFTRDTKCRQCVRVMSYTGLM